MNIDLIKEKAHLYKGRPVAFDTETTGLSKSDEVIQISIVAENGEPLLSTYVRPEKKTSWPGAQRVNGISPQMVRNAPKMREIEPALAEIFDSASVVIGYNVSYDVRMVEQCCDYRFAGYKIVDAMKKFKQDAPKNSSHTLAEAASFYLTPEQKSAHEKNAHDALADTVATMLVYTAQRERVKKPEREQLIVVQQVPPVNAAGARILADIEAAVPGVSALLGAPHGKARIDEVEKNVRVASVRVDQTSAKGALVLPGFVRLLATRNPEARVVIPEEALEKKQFTKLSKIPALLKNVSMASIEKRKLLQSVRADIRDFEAQEPVLYITGDRPWKLSASSRLISSSEAYKKETYAEIAMQLRKVVETAVEAGFRAFATGGEQGVPQLAFWAVHAAKEAHPDIKNVLILPDAFQSSTWAEDGLFSKQQYFAMEIESDEVYFANTSDTRQAAANIKRDQAVAKVATAVVAMCSEPASIESSEPSSRTAAMAMSEGARVAVLALKSRDGVIYASEPEGGELGDILSGATLAAEHELE